MTFVMENLYIVEIYTGFYVRRTLHIFIKISVYLNCLCKILNVSVSLMTLLTLSSLKTNTDTFAKKSVIQSIVCLTSSLVVKMIIILVSTISNSQVFLLKKCEKLLQVQKLLTFFQQKY